MKFKGGIIEYNKFKKEINNLLSDSSVHVVTMMVDIFQLPSSFPFEVKQNSRISKSDIEGLQKRIVDDIGNPRFIPYFQIYEFEALLFTDLSSLPNHVDKFDRTKFGQLLELDISPESINNTKPPGKLLMDVVESYSKVTHGILIAKDIPVDEMRAKCPNFNIWLSNIEERCI